MLVYSYILLALAVFAWEWFLDAWNERYAFRKQPPPASPPKLPEVPEVPEVPVSVPPLPNPLPNPVPPAFPPLPDPRALAYLRARNRAGHAEGAVFLVLTFACVLGGVPAWFGGVAAALAGAHPLTAGVLTFAWFFFVWDLLQIPWEWHSTFRLEAAFGFNRTTPGTFVADLAKGWLVKAVLALPLAFAALWLIRRAGAGWWLPVSALFITFQLLVLFLYPRLIAPLFNKFEPLPDGELKSGLDELATRCGFPVSGILVMDGSRRSGHSNAYFTGFGRHRRLVLYDTLVQQLPPEELHAVLAHEIGHFRHRHLPKLMALLTVLVVGVTFAMSRVLEWGAFRAAFQVPADQPAVALVVLALIAGPFLFWLGPCLHALQRRFEFQADAYAAAATGTGAPLARALLRLAEKNLENLTPLPLYSAWHHSHPAILERIAALENHSLSHLRSSG